MFWLQIYFFLPWQGNGVGKEKLALNHYYDRDIDRIMDRTSQRPILLIKYLREKFSLTDLGCVLLSVAMAWFLLNLYVSAMIFIGIIFYVLIYTIWLKRNNPLNIVIGGLQVAPFHGRMGFGRSIDVTGFLVGWLVFMWTPPLFGA